MNRDEFIEHIRSGQPATFAVAEITGHTPEVVTIADLEDEHQYVRYGVMMAGTAMVALVILQLDVRKIPAHLLARIREGEPAGLVLDGMRRQTFTTAYPQAIRAGALLTRHGRGIGRADEIFTQSLFPVD
jgi:acyl-[acyl carrier protein]--UDP-N-acetylglucosamine O-acyltransferase